MADVIRSADDIDVADGAEIRVRDADTDVVLRYRAMVEDVTPEGVQVSLPACGRVPPAEGTQCVVSIWKGYADHRFRSSVLKRVVGRMPQLVLARPDPGDIRRKPRRSAHRAETRIPARLLLQENDVEQTLEGTIWDLSLGGCRVHLPASLPEETVVKLEFDLPFPRDAEGNDRTRPMQDVGGTVRWGRRHPGSEDDADTPGYRLGIEFAVLDNIKQTLLLRFVALRQRQIIQRLTGKKVEGSEDEEESAVQEAEKDLEETEDQLKLLGDDDAESGNEEERQEETGEAPEEAEDARVEVLPNEPNGKTILVADDEAGIRHVITEALAYEGYRVLRARDGQEALELVRAQPVDLVVTDLMMPRMNGWRLIASMRQHGLQVPVVITTGYMTREGQEVLTSRDVAGFLVKPLELAELVKLAGDIIFPKAEERRRKILAVDDQADSRLLVSRQLERAGFAVETANDGAEGLEKVDMFQPDLVLLDIMMPKMNGFEMCRRLRANSRTADLPVMMLTGRTSSEFVKRALDLKVSGYIVKPFNPGDVIDRINKVLRLPGGEQSCT
jgi:DNA-binding response OmpR family regulator/c-di-GMP-binding flagellar brake protein YcgR